MDYLYARSSKLPPAVGWSSQVPAGNANTFFHLGTAGFAPTKVLNEKIRSRDWDAAKFRVLTHPSDSAYTSKQNSTPLHLACLYRAPVDLVLLILQANPDALFSQDNEGWTPIHVILLYGSDEETALLLIRRGGYRAASINSRIVGAPLHLACRHGCSTAIIRALLQANPSMATTSANEYSTKPAQILWQRFSRNPENERLLKELAEAQNVEELSEQQAKSITDLVDQLSLLLQAAKGRQCMDGKTNIQQNSSVIHRVLGSSEETLGELTHFLPLIILKYPEQVRETDEMGDLPLHIAASNRPSRTVPFGSRRFTTMEFDAVDVLLQHYPTAASVPNSQGLLPLHIALGKGRRTWSEGVASIFLAAPHALIWRNKEGLLPFQLAATIESVSTTVELLLACPHAMIVSQ